MRYRAKTTEPVIEVTGLAATPRAAKGRVTRQLHGRGVRFADYGWAAYGVGWARMSSYGVVTLRLIAVADKVTRGGDDLPKRGRL